MARQIPTQRVFNVGRMWDGARIGAIEGPVGPLGNAP
jgi:hypothetical protein